tara:strand:+ start:162 stop:500 length:339 start_codon:yes stop_codon:yes gene_type:complete
MPERGLGVFRRKPAWKKTQWAKEPYLITKVIRSSNIVAAGTIILEHFLYQIIQTPPSYPFDKKDVKAKESLNLHYSKETTGTVDSIVGYSTYPHNCLLNNERRSPTHATVRD